MRSVLKFGAIVAALVVSASAQAADIPRASRVYKAPVAEPVIYRSPWYVLAGTTVPLSGSGSFQEKSCATAIFVACGQPTSLKPDGGWGGYVGVGYRFNRWLRADARIGAGQGDGTGFSTSAVGTSRIDGEAGIFGFGGHVFLDVAGFFPEGTFGRFEPYVGVGIIHTRVSFKNITATPVNFVGPTLVAPNFADWTTGGTFVLGTAYRFNRHWLLDVAYRYASFSTVESGPGLVSAGVFGALPTAGFEAKGRGHGIDLVVRYEL